MRLLTALIALLATLPHMIWAHAVPDIPVRAYFDEAARCQLAIEVDPRCFAADPNTEPSMLYAVVPEMPAAVANNLKAKAKTLIESWLELQFTPAVAPLPELSFAFTGHNQEPLQHPDDVVVITATCSLPLPKGVQTWQVRSKAEAKLAVVTRVFRDGSEDPQFAVLFPGEGSPAYQIAPPQAPLKTIVFGSCIREFEHPMLERTAAMPMDLLLLMGDNIYADTRDMPTMRAKYDALRQSSFWQTVRSKAPVLATWDDHDYGQDGAGAEYPQRAQAQQEFCRWLGLPPNSPLRHQEGIYQSRRFGPAGRRTQVIVLDTRYFRSPLKLASKKDAALGGNAMVQTDPQTTILGEAQWQWLAQQLKQPAELRLIVSSIQFASAFCGAENWANFPHEQRRMIDLIASSKAAGVLFLSGDRHWCEWSALREAVPYPLLDLTASSMTQIHPRGTPTPNANRLLPETFHRPSVGSLEIDWEQADPRLRFQITDEEGKAHLQHELNLSSLKPGA
jgi:alkaline phosphatase D